MSDQKSEVIRELAASDPLLTNEEIATVVPCSERLVRHVLGSWKDRVKKQKALQNGARRCGLIYDVHVPYHEEWVFQLCLDYLASKGLDELILAGDFVDFYAVSSWSKDPFRLPFDKELEFAEQALERVRNTFPDIPIKYLEGNHEQRIDWYLKKKAPELSRLTKLLSVSALLNLNKYDMEYVSNIRLMTRNVSPYKLGKLFVLHGHETRVSLNTVNLAKLYYTKCHTNVIAGHHHRADKWLVKNLNQQYMGAWTVGCLGKLQESYLPINNWVHGFAYVDYDANYFNVHNKVVIDGQVKNA